MGIKELKEKIARVEAMGKPGNKVTIDQLKQQLAELESKGEETSDKVASTAGKILQDPQASKAAKSLAGSALTQAPDKKKKSK